MTMTNEGYTYREREGDPAAIFNSKFGIFEKLVVLGMLLGEVFLSPFRVEALGRFFAVARVISRVISPPQNIKLRSEES